MRNIIYQTPSFADAQNKQKEIPGTFIDSFISETREDSIGYLHEIRVYEVYEILAHHVSKWIMEEDHIKPLEWGIKKVTPSTIKKEE